MDEAWAFLSTTDGRRTLERLARLGRSQNTTLILATQQLADVGELDNLVGTRFVFGMESAAEARRGAELLGLDPEDRTLIDRIRSNRRGRCLMRDTDGAVGELQIDVVFDDLLAALDTSPAARAAAEDLAA